MVHEEWRNWFLFLVLQHPQLFFFFKLQNLYSITTYTPDSYSSYIICPILKILEFILQIMQFSRIKEKKIIPKLGILKRSHQNIPEGFINPIFAKDIISTNLAVNYYTFEIKFILRNVNVCNVG